jgi:hypothetical protein
MTGHCGRLSSPRIASRNIISAAIASVMRSTKEIHPGAVPRVTVSITAPV